MTAPPNRAERRRRAAGLRRHLHKMNRAAAGLWKAVIIRRGAALHPEVLTAVAAYLQGVRRGGQRCLLCPHGFAFPHAPPAAFALVWPGVDGAIEIGSVAGICPNHAGLPDAVLVDAAFASVLGRGLSLSFKVVPAYAVHPAGGRA